MTTFTPPQDPDVTDVTDVTDTPEGARLLGDVETFIRRFTVLPDEHAYTATTLWVAHAHAVEAFDTTPRLAALSPEPGSGKTRLLEVLELLSPNPMLTFNVSVAVLYRSMTPDEDGFVVDRPTIMLDEADTVFGPRASKDHEDLRGFVNAGYRSSGYAQRVAMTGKTFTIETFPCFAPVALAGLNDLPDTIMTRSIGIRMRRRAPGERVEPYRRRRQEPEGHALRDDLADWLNPHLPALADTWPDLPDVITDRDADCWEPLIAIADLAGGEWPTLARDAAVVMVKAAEENSTTSLNVRLLGSLRTVFNSKGNPAHLPTEVIIKALHEMEEEPWSDLRGKALDARDLSRRLRQYGVKPKQDRDGPDRHRGYRRADLEDPWSRYLPSETPVTPVTPESPAPSETPVTPVTRASSDRPRCDTCGNPILLVVPGRNRCERCERAS